MTEAPITRTWRHAGQGGGAESKIFDPGLAAVVRLFSLEYTQLPTEDKKLERECCRQERKKALRQ